MFRDLAIRFATTAAIAGLSIVRGADPGASPRPTIPPPPPFAETVTTFSQTGQFVVSGPRPKTPRPIETRPSREAPRELTAQTLAVSCERVKSEILRALELPDTWRAGGGSSGKILVAIDASVRTNTSLAVAATPYERGWQFRLALPLALSEDRLVRALTEAIVTELASRAGNQRLGEPPLWFVEGLTQTVLAAVPGGVIVQPQTRGISDVRLDEALAGVRRELARQPPVGFHELGQPDLSRMDQRRWATYSACAHLFVHELSRRPDGREQIVRWLGTLQKYWNWQTGFTEAFQPGFRSLLDAEKWWALTLANFTGRNPAAAWPVAFALRKLDESLQPVGVLPGAGGRASRLAIPEIIGSWDFPRQTSVLRQTLQQLHAIRLSSPPELTPIVSRYIDVLEEYLDARSRSGLAPMVRGQAPPSPKLLIREAVGRLRELDGERARLNQDLVAPKPPPASGT